VRLEYKDHTLAQIFVYEGNCQTSRGVRVGDSQSKVQKLYGNGKKTTVEIKKGEGDSLGKLGDFVLEYPGVAFVISKVEWPHCSSQRMLLKGSKAGTESVENRVHSSRTLR